MKLKKGSRISNLGPHSSIVNPPEASFGSHFLLTRRCCFIFLSGNCVTPRHFQSYNDLFWYDSIKLRMWTGSRGWVPMGQMIFSWPHNDPRSSIISWHGILIGFGPFLTYPGPSRSSRFSIHSNGDKLKLQNLLWSHTWPNWVLMGITTFWHRLLMCINYKIGHLWELGDLECWSLGQFWGNSSLASFQKLVWAIIEVWQSISG